MKILIAETGQHVLQVAKYYRKMGHEIILATPSKGEKSYRFLKSRYVSNNFIYEYHSNVVDEILEIKKVFEREKCDIFFPFGFHLVTKYLNSILQNSACKMKTPYLDGYGYWQLSDKNALYKTVSQTSVQIPKKIGLIRGYDIEYLNECNFPVILKRVQGVGIKNNVCLAWNIEDINYFISINNIKNDSLNEFIMQEYIPGDIFDVGGFAINGELYYAIPQRRTITLPLRGGVAAVNDIYPDTKLIDQASEILNAVKWTGPFQAEFRWNPQDLKYYIIEVNAKMWGSTPLSLLSNPDILQIALDVALGNKPRKSLDYKANIRYRWICQQELLAISKGNIKDKINFISRFLIKSHYDFDLNDPVYSFIKILGTIHRIIFNRNSIPDPLINKSAYKKFYSKKN